MPDPYDDLDAASAIRVGPTLRQPWFIAVVILGAVALLGGVVLMFSRQQLGAAVAMLGLCGLVGAGLAALMLKRRQKLVWFDDASFLVRDARGERAYRHEHVICASHWLRPNYVNGAFRSTTLSLEVWVQSAEGAERLLLARTINPGEEDPLAGLVERIFQQLYAGARAALTAGHPFEGENFTLDGSTLRVTTRRLTTEVELAGLVAAEVVDGQLCIWCGGDVEPRARVDMRWANAPVLQRLLAEQSREDAPASEQPADDLGRLRFERRPPAAAPLAGWGVLLVAIALAAGFVTLAAMKRQPALLLVAGVAVVGGGGLTLAILHACNTLRCHELGVVVASPLSRKVMRFSEVSSLTCAATRHYVKGVYSGTRLSMTLLASGPGKPRKLTYSKTFRNADHELESLCDRVAVLLAAKRLDRLNRGQSVPWTDGLTMLPHALEYKAAGLLGRKKAVVIPYEEIAGTAIEDGHFYLWVGNQKKPLVKEGTGSADFFPGHAAFLMWLGSAPARRTIARPEAPADEQRLPAAGNVE